MTDSTGHRDDPAEDDARDSAAEAPAQPAPEAPTDLKDRLLRALAEMENLRRRTEREVADARSYGIASFARDVLNVADNMRRALDAFGPELRESADAGVKALVEGVELTDRELQKALEKHGVRRFDPTGEKFDPNVHQAMFEIEDASAVAGIIKQVVQVGYMIGDRVLRPAMVAVAKGGPKAAAEKAESAPANDNPAATPHVDRTV